MHQPPPASLLVYLKRERIRYQILFDSTRPFFMSSCSTQGETDNTCTKLWKYANDLVKEAGVQPMHSIYEMTSVSARMFEVEDLKNYIQENIQSLMQFEEHLLKLSQLTQKIQYFVKATSGHLYQEVSTNFCKKRFILREIAIKKTQDHFK